MRIPGTSKKQKEGEVKYFFHIDQFIVIGIKGVDGDIVPVLCVKGCISNGFENFQEC